MDREIVTNQNLLGQLVFVYTASSKNKEIEIC